MVKYNKWKHAKSRPILWIGVMVFLVLPTLGLVLKSLHAFKTGGHLLHENYYGAPVTTGAVIVLTIVLIIVAIFYFFGSKITKSKYQTKEKKCKKQYKFPHEDLPWYR